MPPLGLADLVRGPPVVSHPFPTEGVSGLQGPCPGCPILRLLAEPCQVLHQGHPEQEPPTRCQPSTGTAQHRVTGTWHGPTGPFATTEQPRSVPRADPGRGRPGRG